MLRAEYDGCTVVSTDLTDEEWKEIGKAAQHKADARLLSPITHDPMMCVQHSSGLRFFRVHPGGHSGVGEDETDQHQRMKAETYEAAKQLGYTAHVEQAAEDRNWIADVLIERPGMRPLAVEIQWSKQGSDEFTRRTDRYAAAGIDCIWLDAGIDYPTVERDCWAGRADTETCYPTPWSGIEPVDGVIRLPVSRETEQVRYDGAWHTVADTIRDLLTGMLRLDVLPAPEVVTIKDVRCPGCGRLVAGWKVEGTPFWTGTGTREEELYRHHVARFLAGCGRLADCCPIQTFVFPGRRLVRAFGCPYCGTGIRENMFEAVGYGPRLAVPGVRTVAVMRTDGVPVHEDVYPSDFGLTTFDRLTCDDVRGCTVATRADVAMRRMRLLGWRMGAVRRLPSIGDVKRIKLFARALVRRFPELAESGSWWSSPASVGCGELAYGLSARNLSGLHRQ